MTRWYAIVTPPPMPLPIDGVLPELLSVLAVRRSVVLQAPPGAGKTTRVPPALLDRVEGSIIVLEPRRLAARLSAKRVAEERGQRLGDQVGYEVRFERAVSASTRLFYVTEGILTRKLLDDPTLRGVGAVVLDEFHERHLQGDLALALLQRMEHGPKLVVMSATLDAAPVARYLDAPIVTSEGKRFEVALEHLSQVDDRPLASQVASAVRRLVHEGLAGDVLVFLPGAAEIKKATEACAAIAREADLLLLPLHGDLPPAAQDKAIARADRRKIVLSTNVAETSITIDGVLAVVDSGLARIAGHDPWTGRPTLEVAKISRASAAQRAGRAGRTAPGRALRLYTKGDHDTRREHDLPEIARVDLAETVLQLRSSSIDPRAFSFLDPPARPALDAADALLRSLGALDEQGKVTAVGARMARFPLSPRASRLVVEAEARGVGAEGCAIAAILSEGRDLFARSFDGPALRNDDAPSDLLARLDALDDASGDGRLDLDRARRNGLDVGAVVAIDRVRRQLERGVQRGGAAKVHPDDALRMAVLAAFPDRVGRRRARETQGRVGIDREIVLSSGGTATLEETSVVKTAPWLVAVEARDVKGKARVWMASAIEPEWLIDLFPASITETVDVTWNAGAERVEAVERMLYDRLVLDERPAGAAADEPAARLLVDRALAAGTRAFLAETQAEALDRLRARVRFVIGAAPDLAEAAKIAPLDEEGLRALLVARCSGKRSFSELRDGTLFDELRNTIGHAALARLDALAPDHLLLPNGRKPSIEYLQGQAPSVASRLQDFFGRTETPRLADGRVPLVLHLLAPNGRDVQVTTDLAGFWERHYPALRNELMRRYPRHAWPTDPKTAAPPVPRGR